MFSAIVSHKQKMQKVNADSTEYDDEGEYPSVITQTKFQAFWAKFGVLLVVFVAAIVMTVVRSVDVIVSILLSAFYVFTFN